MRQYIGLIPARRDSKGIRRKNLYVLGGKPLLEYTIQAALRSTQLDRVVLSSNDPDALTMARELGIEVPFVRPEALARDNTPMVEVVQHTVSELKLSADSTAVVLLQPTSPLRAARHIDGAIDVMTSSNANSVISVVHVPHLFSPDSLYSVNTEAELAPVAHAEPLGRRQEKPQLYARNGPAVLVTRTAAVIRGSLYAPPSRAFVMPWQYSIDIDSDDDLELAAILLQAHPDWYDN